LDFGINEISAITIKENISSQKLIEKLGFKFIGTINISNDKEKLLLYKLKK